MTEHNQASLQADLVRIKSFLLSTEIIQQDNLLAQFFAYKNKHKSIQTQEDDTTNTAESAQTLNKVRNQIWENGILNINQNLKEISDIFCFQINNQTIQQI